MNLALSYRDGEGVAKSARWSQYWMLKAAEAGDSEARRLVKKS